MKKIGIVTIIDGCNYGNRLQNYALQYVLRMMGYDVFTVNHKSSRDLSTVRLILSKMKNHVKARLGRAHSLWYYQRKQRFASFNKEYIKFTPEVLNSNLVPEGFCNNYDCFVVGSDQVWNTNFDFISEDIRNYLLAYAPKDKRIAYAASFGTASIPKDYIQIFSEELPQFKRISVRERKGIEIVKEFATVASVVLDPTLLLTRDEWRTVSRKPSYISSGERFVLTYIMSGRTNIIDNHVDRIKMRYSASEVVNLDIEYIKSDKVRNKDHYITDPAEFLWLIDNAQCVITDSYHASVFSLIFKKPLLTYQRQGLDMSDRLISLMTLIDSHINIDDYDNPTQFPSMLNYDKVDLLIEQERRSSLNWLKSSLS